MKRTFRYIGLLAVTALMAVVVGCAAIGQPTPQTFNERLLTGYATVTEVRSVATELVLAKKLNADDAKNVQAQADNARAGLDVARSLSGVDLGAANSKLTATVTVLSAIRSYLTLKGGT